MVELNPCLEGANPLVPAVYRPPTEAPNAMSNQIRRCMLSFVLLTLGTFNALALEPPVPPAPLTTYSYELIGSSEKSLIKEGCVRSLKSSVGQVYFSDYMLYARDLLDAYVEQNWENLIARYKVTASEMRGGRRYVALQVVVDNRKLYADLAEKKFLYRPAIRPILFIFLAETYDGEAAPPSGRRRLLEMIDSRQYRYLWAQGDNASEIPLEQRKEMPLTLRLPEKDVSLNPEDLENAMRESQRNEVEVFLSATIESKTIRTEKLYFDDYTFVQTRCSLKLMRSDTGEVLVERQIVTSAGNADATAAVRAATLAGINEIAPQIFDTFDKMWGKMIHRKADLRIMATGVNEEVVSLFRQIITGMAPTAEIYVRSYYSDVAVLTLTWDGRTEDLLEILRQTEYPAFTATLVKPGALIISTLIRPGELIIEVPEKK